MAFFGWMNSYNLSEEIPGFVFSLHYWIEVVQDSRVFNRHCIEHSEIIFQQLLVAHNINK